MKEIDGIVFGKTTGRERNRCPVCEKKFEKDDEIVSYIKGSYRQYLNFGYAHARCFFKLLLMRYAFDINEIKKEIVVESLK